MPDCSTPSDPQSGLIARLAALGLWREDATIHPLAGGITNRNYAIRCGAAPAYVARLCEPQPLLGIDRRNEVVCEQAAGAWGLAPELIHHEDGLLVARFVEGKTLSAADLADPSVLDRVAALFRRLHGAWDTLTGEVLYFCPFQTVRTYAQTAARLGGEMPGDMAAILEDTRGLSRRIAPFRPVLCHNDLLPSNLIDGGRRLWLVDWEYAGIGHPLFDLASVSANAALNEELEVALLSTYRATERVDPRELAELRVFRAVSLLREALWAVIQSVASDIDFDYDRYARENFEAYRAARNRLD
jgi:thiamine kinase-like enzyme